MPSFEPDSMQDTAPLETEDAIGKDSISVSPFPLPTGFRAYRSPKLSLPDDNEVYLDFTPKVRLPERVIRRYLGFALGLIAIYLVYTLALDIISLTGQRPAFERLRGLLADDGWLISVGAFIAFILISSVLRSIWVWTRPYPMRFNRQRREMAYIADADQRTRFIAWEKIGAFVRGTDTHTSLLAEPIRIYTLNLVLFSEDDAETNIFLSSHSSLEKAMGEWESIRIFMERGRKYLPADSVAHDAMGGTLEHLHMLRDLYKQGSYLRYLLVFIPLNLLAGGTLPFHIARWIKKLPRVEHSKEMREWSQAIPSRSWKRPDELFRELTLERLEYLNTGKTLMDYQRECVEFVRLEDDAFEEANS
ncbi:hypothetical protein [Pseudomonas ovata]|uniref:hypothetical protein n=1 Tax=Pseudomonas ovata TaxID=1839709 RepID=UPI000D68958D|nr:hypothetical protein [Pseudomonas ovata]